MSEEAYDSGVHCVHGVVSCERCLDRWSGERRALQAESTSLRSRLSAVEAERDLFKAHCESLSKALEGWLSRPIEMDDFANGQRSSRALEAYRKDFPE